MSINNIIWGIDVQNVYVYAEVYPGSSLACKTELFNGNSQGCQPQNITAKNPTLDFGKGSRYISTKLSI